MRPAADDAHPWFGALWIGLTLAASLSIFFRDALSHGLMLLYGDSYDGLIEIAILEHWYGVVAHHAAVTRMAWFYPYADTLGYNDTYFLPALAYVPARLAGFDPMLAAFVSHVAMKAVGWAGMYHLLRRGLRVRQWLALGGATVFATSNASLLHMYHAQLLAVGMVPWLMTAAIAVGRAAVADDRSRLRRSGAVFAILFGATALSAFYQAWFFGVFALVFAIVGYFVAGAEAFASLRAAMLRHSRVLIEIAVMAAIALIPLLIVYLPVFALGHHHDWQAAVLQYVPTFGTFINVGTGNVVWGRLLPSGLGGGEDRFGFAPGIIVLFLSASVWTVRHRREETLAWTTAATLLVFAVLVVRWPSYFTLWRAVYEFVPGASAVRVVSRFLLFALVPMIAVVVVFLDRAGLGRVATVAMMAYLLAEEVQTAAPLTLDRAVQLRMLAAIGPPPPKCRAFFVVSARAPEPVALEAGQIMASWGGGDAAALLRRYRHNVDAMLLSSYYRVPTINGFSTFNPDNWNSENPDGADYLDRVRAYAARHHLSGLCALDRRLAHPWRAFDQPEPPGAGYAR